MPAVSGRGACPAAPTALAGGPHVQGHRQEQEGQVCVIE
jgi:hypothetical protein